MSDSSPGPIAAADCLGVNFPDPERILRDAETGDVVGVMRKLLLAQTAVEPVRKHLADDKDREYGYARLDDVVNACRAALIDNGLVFETEPHKIDRSIVGKQWMFATVELIVRVTDVDTGECLVRRAIGTGADRAPGADAVPAATSMARKTAFLNLLNVPMIAHDAEVAPDESVDSPADAVAEAEAFVHRNAALAPITDKQKAKVLADSQKHELSENDLNALSEWVCDKPWEKLTKNRASDFIRAIPNAKRHFAALAGSSDPRAEDIRTRYKTSANGSEPASGVESGSEVPA